MDWTAYFDTLSQVVQHSAAQVTFTIFLTIAVQALIRASIDKVVHRVVKRHKYTNKIDEHKREQTLSTIFRTALAVVLWIFAIFIILWQLNIDITALLTGAGLIGIVVGFGAQQAIRDFLAGIFILSENQYRVGDIITLNAEGVEVSGMVEDISIRITRMRDLDGNLHIVRNGSVNTITNRSFKYANVNVDVGIAYDTDIDKVEKVINQVGDTLSKDPLWAEHIFEPIQFLRVEEFEASSIRIKALGKVEPAKQWDIAGEFRRRLKKAFDKNNITIAFPQVVVHSKNDSQQKTKLK